MEVPVIGKELKSLIDKASQVGSTTMLSKTKYYVSVLSILLLAVTIGVLGIRGVAAQAEPGDPDPTLGGVDLTRSGFYIQSQHDPLWNDWRILSNTDDGSG